MQNLLDLWAEKRLFDRFPHLEPRERVEIHTLLLRLASLEAL